MNNKKHIDQSVEDALQSAGDAARAAAKPYLLTRINARLQQSKNTVWDRMLGYIGRPAIAFSGLLLLVSVNVFTISYNRYRDVVSTEQAPVSLDEFPNTIATIYETDNP